MTAPVNAPQPDATPSESIHALLDSLSDYIEQYHGGAVRFVALEGDVLQVRLEGACLGCPLSPNTLHGWVEGTVRQFFPFIRRVEDVGSGGQPLPGGKA